MRHWGWLLASTAALTVTGAFAGTASAQGLRSVAPAPKDKADEKKSDAESPKNGDIVVTATRRSQRLSSVPIAVSAYGTVALQNLGRPISAR